MPMKKFFAILLLFPMLWFGCSKEDDVQPEQRKRIESFLTSSHSPRLVAEENLEEGSSLPFYTTAGNKVYRYIENYYDPDRVNWPEVTASSKVAITFRIYSFDNYTSITDTTVPIYTNDPEWEQKLEKLGLTLKDEEGNPIGIWNFEPKVITPASSGIINGLRLALLGCRQGDHVEAYMTYNMAYGDEDLGIIEKESPLAIFFTINTVE